MVEISLHPSNRIIKKGDYFKIFIDIINDTDEPVIVSEFSIAAPPMFMLLEKNEYLRRLEKLRHILKIGKKKPFVDTVKLPLEKPVEIQPNSSYRDDFHLKAGWSWGIFGPRPDNYRMYVQVAYSNGAQTSYKQETLDINLYPSFGSMVFGTLLGSLLGSIVRFFDPLDNDENRSGFDFDKLWNPEAVVSVLIVPVILGFVASLVLARRKDVQSFLTIEDFWGGIVLGFIIGYSGSEAIKQLLRIAP